MTHPPMPDVSTATGERPDDRLSRLRLDLYSSEQLYRQLYRALRAAILSGDFSEGEAIPSENQLRDQFGIARTTVRNAMALLVSEGLVQQVRGRGTIVSHRPISHNIWNFGSFTELARKQGQRPVTQVLEHRADNGQLVLVRARGLANGDSVTWLNVDTSELDLALYPGLDRYDFASQSLYEVLRRDYDRHPLRSELLLTVVPASDRLREVFAPAQDVPGYLCASGDVLDADDRLVERTSIVYSPAVQMKFATRWGRETAPHGVQET
ncbi:MULTISPECIES: GntR family transcriptional regulator [Ensifer]|uniref:GntR family transcriptional regulator n=1 Tax=Ensifer adhaerens TaxID=106592 RepID=A0ABY8HV72_ENSAD|nr:MULTISPECIES: GntR family transcriptional regulator [Ensifer]WFP95350.1 GntR family transcriptional regulator [Ensifer adhaerens]SFH07575.1 GntR family transcriptional regulator [Ensifer sp. OV372]